MKYLLSISLLLTGCATRPKKHSPPMPPAVQRTEPSAAVSLVRAPAPREFKIYWDEEPNIAYVIVGSDDLVTWLEVEDDAHSPWPLLTISPRRYYRVGARYRE